MYKKVIVSGDIIEVYEMEYEPFNGYKNPDLDEYKPFEYLERVKKDSTQLDIDFVDRWDFRQEKFLKKLSEVDRKKERRAQTSRDSRNHVRRLALSNFTSNSKFLTLTFKRNETDLDKANKIFKSYVRKLRKIKQGMKYIAVIEFQERGAIHYHMICDLPFVPWEKLLMLWRSASDDLGGVDVRNIKSVDNVGAYLVKYMMKNAGDERLKGKKMYLCSQGLEKPKVYNSLSAGIVIKTYLENRKEIFTNNYESEYLGKITYKEYNLKQNEKYRNDIKTQNSIK